MVDQIVISNIPEKSWRAAIAALTVVGWSVQGGGGLDFSWALFTYGEMKIAMEYDIWQDGEIVISNVDTEHIKNILPADIIARISIV